jgi:YD repeat-containing protein
MKKYLACLAVFSMLFTSLENSFADFNTINPSPYSMGVEGRPVQDLQDYYKPSQMVSILPNTPVAAKDKYGNTLYFTPSGKLSAKVSKDGSVSLSLASASRTLDANGNLVQQTENVKGSNIVEVKDGQGRITGYNELGFGGKVVKQYDYLGNLTVTNQYDKFGKNLSTITDELTKSKTVCDKAGNALYDINYEGSQTAWYTYNDAGRLSLKTDVAGNKTYFTDDGRMSYSENYQGKRTMTYNYGNDANGNLALLNSVDDIGNVTTYSNNKPQKTVDTNGKSLSAWFYTNDCLVCSVDYSLNETTWYDIDGKPLAASVDGYLSKQWLYADGKNVGVWDESTYTLSAMIRGQEVMKLMMPNKPTGEDVSYLIDKGYIRKFYDSDVANTDEIINNIYAALSSPQISETMISKSPATPSQVNGNKVQRFIDRNNLIEDYGSKALKNPL